jgi:ribosomal protein S27E
MDKNGIQTGIWMIGIGALAITGYWWPGIMFVVGISALFSGSIQTAVWMFGIGIVAHFGFWWPGMIIVIGISLLAEAVFPEKEKVEDTEENEDAEWPAETPIQDEPAQPTAKPQPGLLAKKDDKPPSWLPAYCPSCGGPLSGQKVIIHSQERVSCPWCATVIEKDQ